MADKKYDSAQLESDTSELKTRETALHTAGDSINSELGTLETDWQGNASEAFLAAAQKWQQGYSEVISAFGTLNKLLGIANEGFGQAETSRTTASTGSWT